MTTHEIIAAALYEKAYGGAPWSEAPADLRRCCEAEADAVIAALTAAGFAVVPREATHAMAEVGATAHVAGRKVDKADLWDACVAWRAMVKAAA